MADKKIPEINAGSMADIAFLLLVFFLVTTTIQTDAGLFQPLPQWVDNPDIDVDVQKNKRNVLQVIMTAGDQLIVSPGSKGDQLNFDVMNLKQTAIDFITNNGRDGSLSDSPIAAVILVQNDNGTSYNTYLKAMNEIQAAYNAIWDQQAKDTYGRLFDQLDKDKQLEIRNKYPRVVSEADPTEFEKK